MVTHQVILRGRTDSIALAVIGIGEVTGTSGTSSSSGISSLSTIVGVGALNESLSWKPGSTAMASFATVGNGCLSLACAVYTCVLQ